MRYPDNTALMLMLSVVMLLSTTCIKAQNASDFSNFLRLEQANASKLIAAYTSPAIRGVSYGMTNGWYHTAKAHKSLGFDLGVTMSAVFIPTSENYFSPGDLQLANTTFTNVTHPGLGGPTIFGNKDVTNYTSTYTPTGLSAALGPQTVSFSGPEGLDLAGSIGFSAVPVPMIQLGIGIIKNTDLKIRLLPERTVGGNSPGSTPSKISMLGFGLLHDIKQYIPGIKLAPFDLSILVAYNSVAGETSLVSSGSTGQPQSSDGNVSYKLNSWIVQGVISKKFSVFTLYGGLGYGSVNTNVDVTGTFIIPAVPSSFSVKDPVAINFSNNGVKFNAGFRLKFGPVYLNTDYTIQKYNALTVGFGLSVR